MMPDDLPIVDAFEENHITGTYVTDERDDFARYPDDRRQLREADTDRHERGDQAAALDPSWCSCSGGDSALGLTGPGSE